MSQATRILASLVIGLTLGILVAALAPGSAGSAADWAEPVGTLWLNALRMTIVPLVVSLLVTGIAATARAGRASRLAGRALATFIGFLWLSSALGAALTFLLLDLFPVPVESAAALRSALSGVAPVGDVPGFAQFLTSIIPTNPIGAAANDQLLPLIVFTLVFAFAIIRLPEEKRITLTSLFQAVADAMLIVINWVLWLAPIGVTALAFALGARAGTAAFGALAHYVAIVSSVGIALWILSVPVALIGGRVSPGRFLAAIAPSWAVAVSTQSSLATLPAMLRGTERLGIRARISGVTLPMAVAIFRWTGPAMNLAVPIYIAHWYGVTLGPAQIAAGIAAAAITTLGAVSLPGTISFVTSIAPVAVALGAPIEPLALLVAVETIPDIFRTVGNVSMDVATTATIARGAPDEEETETDALLAGEGVP